MADAIREGRVTVNGKTAEDFRQPVDPRADRVTLDGRPLAARPEKPLCLMLNKPAGVLSTTGDERGGTTVLDILPGRYRRLRLYPVGRLDKDTTGLLLLTNDGDLTNQLTHPRYEHEREYLVRVDGTLSAAEKARLERGIMLDDGMTSRARVKDVGGKAFNYSITIHEGRKRQVRRMLARLGHGVRALKRVRIGNLLLGDLKEGEVRELTGREIARLLER
jgi:23S rRNA pseudouridine2605 synthase